MHFNKILCSRFITWLFLTMVVELVTGGQAASKPRSTRLAKFSTCFFNESNPSESCALGDLVGSTFLFPGGSTSCYGKHTQGDSWIPFFFQVNPGKGEDRNKLLLYFDGGGFYTHMRGTIPTLAQVYGHQTPRPQSDGIFNVQDTRNPYQNWTMVLILYCSGDAHIGNNMSSDGLVRWSGRNNTKAVLDWVYTNLPNPESVLLSGCSAGSFGLQYWSHSLIDHYQALSVSPLIRVLYEAWVGFDPYDGNEHELWDVCSGASDFAWPVDLKSLCQSGDLSLSAVQRFTQASHRDIPFSFLSYKGDRVQRVYFCSITAKTESIPCSEKSEYQVMKEILVNYTLSATPGPSNVLTFWINGVGHTIQQKSSFLDNNELLAWMRSFTETPAIGNTLFSACVPGKESLIPGREDYGCDSILSDANFSC